MSSGIASEHENRAYWSGSADDYRHPVTLLV